MPAHDKAHALLRRVPRLHAGSWRPQPSFQSNSFQNANFWNASFQSTIQRPARCHSTATSKHQTHHTRRQSPRLAKQGALAAGCILTILALTY
ncbi:hypothetical protein IMZ48_23195, partial [Candidatus Bathyarchaeota archaeon]|nr:hypothetical protein [Candidatus Bathyarchaeota archaeon]